MDSTVPDSTDPDIVTDTLGPQPVSPAFRLIGNEPFWGLTIDSTGMRFRTPEDTAGLRFGASIPVMVGDSLRWNSLGEGGTIEAIVVPGLQ
ncbi:MAG: hypothetical protein ACT4P7_03590 [Gemmatimonadaceae bacterium]